jgi:hypothetical protein
MSSPEVRAENIESSTSSSPRLVDLLVTALSTRATHDLYNAPETKGEEALAALADYIVSLHPEVTRLTRYFWIVEYSGRRTLVYRGGQDSVHVTLQDWQRLFEGETPPPNTGREQLWAMLQAYLPVLLGRITEDEFRDSLMM